MLVQGKEKTTAKNNFSLNRFEALMDLTNTSYDQLNALIEYDVRSMMHDKQRTPMKNVVSKCCEYMNIIDGYEYCFMICSDFSIADRKAPLKKEVIKLGTNEIENSLRVDILKKRIKEPSCKWNLKSLSTIFGSPSRFASLSTIKNIKKLNKYEASTLCYALQLDPQLLFKSDHFSIDRERYIFENQTYSINKEFKNKFLNSDALKTANIPKWFVEGNEKFSKKMIMLIINSYNKISNSNITFDEVTNHNNTINVSSLMNSMMSNSLEEEKDYKDFVPSEEDENIINSKNEEKTKEEENKKMKKIISTFNKNVSTDDNKDDYRRKTTAKDIYHLIDRLTVEEMNKLEKYIDLRKQLLDMKYGNDNI